MSPDFQDARQVGRQSESYRLKCDCRQDSLSGDPAFPERESRRWSSLMETVLIFALVGFIAQIIDGTLGMAYGVSANSFMLAFGIPPALASASIHAAECVTTGISGLSHLGFGNVDKKLAARLIIPGVIGAVLGAYLL